MAKFLSDGIGWLRRSLSDHENVQQGQQQQEQADGESEEMEELGEGRMRSGRRRKQQQARALPQQTKSLDLPRYRYHGDTSTSPSSSSSEIDFVDGNSPTKNSDNGQGSGRESTRSTSDSGIPPPNGSSEDYRRRLFLQEEEEEFEVIGESKMLTKEEMTTLATSFPSRLVGASWTLLLNTERDGFSLRNIYRKMEGRSGHALLVIKDSNGGVFGAFTSDPLRVSETFYGTGETFLFRTRPAPVSVFKWCSTNEMFISCSASALVVGAGDGIFGLSLDSDLSHGRSRKCQTFQNEVLSVEGDFMVSNIEVWVFNT